MRCPEVKAGDWIRIQSSENSPGVDGYVFSVIADGELSVGYYQNGLKAIKEDVVWKDSHWAFKYDGPNGSYLRGSDEAIVKAGPYQQQKYR